ncbi:uncharacterized protein LOC125008126 isoform X2 [Mugil cephalus]|uniref:uncharacterized protein LOC125008126 isoform X2 n=1 Tax=Mugil cephalus TaxID=48193 RepID=UPI001FB77B3F|nr:uncharacterized protein LOC125008126 isoform X2 [Mugil cephalus]
MGNEQSTLVQKGYVTTENKEKYLIATKEDDTFFIKNIPLERIKQTASALTSEIDTLVTISHPHIVSSKEYFTDQNFYYVVMDYCQGGTLDAKIRGGSSFQQEFEVLSCFVEICLAVKTIHEKGLLHKDLKTESIFLTEFGIACLGGFGKIHENTSSGQVGKINYLAPEVFTDGTYTSKSDIWSLGCILFELCTQKPACKTTVEDLQIKLKNLRALADGLERVHKGTTVGSLTGGVIGAVGGITSIVGLILAPFTLGASLIVTGVGVGVSVAGGATAAASNITNMVNESSDRKAIRNMIKEFEKKINAVVFWLQQIGNSLETIRSSCDSVSTLDNNSTFKTENLVSLGFRAGKGLGGIAELVRLVQVTNIGKIATQASRAVLVAEVATGVLSGLFVAVDVFFIAMDAKEIHHIRKAQAAEMQPDAPRPELLFESEMSDFVPASDQTTLLSDSLMKESDVVENESESQDQSSVRSEIMKFVRSVRNAADNLEKVLNELKTITLSIPSLGYKWEVEWQDMEFR